MTHLKLLNVYYNSLLQAISYINMTSEQNGPTVFYYELVKDVQRYNAAKLS